jgi:hypothetical protein
LVSAIVDRKDFPELRTMVYSQTRFSAMLEDNPAAISLAPSGVGSGERLLALFSADVDRIFQPLLEKHRRSDPWLFFTQQAGRLSLEQTLRDDELSDSVRNAMQRLSEPSIVLIRQVDALKAKFEAVLDALNRSVNVRGRRETSAEPASESDREEIIRIRRQMLARASGTYSSEELATAAKSTTTNSSQLGADQRSSGRIFGVRLGREWHYPKFQFDTALRALPEMKPILAALSPDPQGWDRLQWFLQPHEKLNGRTPLQVWEIDRRKVIEAANTERWNGRD